MADQVVIQVTKNDYDIMPENSDFPFLMECFIALFAVSTLT
jgi:hypothetical protein